MNINYKGKLAALSFALLCACASPTVVQSVKPGDSGLNCAQLQNEYADAENLKKEAGDVKGVTGGNVVHVKPTLTFCNRSITVCVCSRSSAPTNSMTGSSVLIVMLGGGDKSTEAADIAKAAKLAAMIEE